METNKDKKYKEPTIIGLAILTGLIVAVGRHYTEHISKGKVFITFILVTVAAYALIKGIMFMRDQLGITTVAK